MCVLTLRFCLIAITLCCVYVYLLLRECTSIYGFLLSRLHSFTIPFTFVYISVYFRLRLRSFTVVYVYVRILLRSFTFSAAFVYVYVCVYVRLCVHVRVRPRSSKG